MVQQKKLQNIHHKKLCKAGPIYEIVKGGPLCGTSTLRQSLNNMYCAIFFCHLVAVGQVYLTRELCCLCVVSGALGSYFPKLKQIVINYVNCVKF
jgi:hypothetical protein